MGGSLHQLRTTYNLFWTRLKGLFLYHGNKADLRSFNALITIRLNVRHSACFCLCVITKANGQTTRFQLWRVRKLKVRFCTLRNTRCWGFYQSKPAVPCQAHPFSQGGMDSGRGWKQAANVTDSGNVRADWPTQKCSVVVDASCMFV